MESSHANTIAPEEWVFPFTVGLQYKRNVISVSMLYENRNFGMAGPRYRELGGNNYFMINLWERMQSLNLHAGIEVLNAKKRLGITPEVGFGVAYLGGYSISQNNPSLDDFSYYRHMLLRDEQDNRVIQSGNMHYVMSSKYIPWIRMMMRVSYKLTPRILLYSRIIYCRGLIPFFRTKFIIYDETLDEPIIGTTSYSGTTFGIRFGVSYCFRRSSKIQTHLP